LLVGDAVAGEEQQIDVAVLRPRLQPVEAVEQTRAIGVGEHLGLDLAVGLALLGGKEDGKIGGILGGKAELEVGELVVALSDEEPAQARAGYLAGFDAIPAQPDCGRWARPIPIARNERYNHILGRQRQGDPDWLVTTRG